jgi:hypothetical protein
MGGGSQSQPIRDSLAVYLLPPKCRPSRMCQLGRQRCTIKFLLFLAVACCCLCRSCFDWVSARSTALSLLWTALFLRIDSWSSSRALAALSSKFSGKLTTSIVTVPVGLVPVLGILSTKRQERIVWMQSALVPVLGIFSTTRRERIVRVQSAQLPLLGILWQGTA